MCGGTFCRHKYYGAYIDCHQVFVFVDREISQRRVASKPSIVDQDIDVIAGKASQGRLDEGRSWIPTCTEPLDRFHLGVIWVLRVTISQDKKPAKLHSRAVCAP
jgi:hypothetical protein